VTPARAYVIRHAVDIVAGALAELNRVCGVGAVGENERRVNAAVLRLRRILADVAAQQGVASQLHPACERVGLGIDDSESAPDHRFIRRSIRDREPGTPLTQVKRRSNRIIAEDICAANPARGRIRLREIDRRDPIS